MGLNNGLGDGLGQPARWGSRRRISRLWARNSRPALRRRPAHHGAKANKLVGFVHATLAPPCVALSPRGPSRPVEELRALRLPLGLPSTGTRSGLVSRLREHCFSTSATVCATNRWGGTPSSRGPSRPVEELRALSLSLGLPSAGTPSGSSSGSTNAAHPGLKRPGPCALGRALGRRACALSESGPRSARNPAGQGPPAPDGPNPLPGPLCSPIVQSPRKGGSIVRCAQWLALKTTSLRPTL